MWAVTACSLSNKQLHGTVHHSIKQCLNSSNCVLESDVSWFCFCPAVAPSTLAVGSPLQWLTVIVFAPGLCRLWGVRVGEEMLMCFSCYWAYRSFNQTESSDWVLICCVLSLTQQPLGTKGLTGVFHKIVCISHSYFIRVSFVLLQILHRELQGFT